MLKAPLSSSLFYSLNDGVFVNMGSVDDTMQFNYHHHVDRKLGFPTTMEAPLSSNLLSYFDGF